MTYNSRAGAGADKEQQQASRPTRVELEPIGLSERGRRYRVPCAGETLVEGRRNSIFRCLPCPGGAGHHRRP